MLGTHCRAEDVAEPAAIPYSLAPVPSLLRLDLRCLVFHVGHGPVLAVLVEGDGAVAFLLAVGAHVLADGDAGFELAHAGLHLALIDRRPYILRPVIVDGVDRREVGDPVVVEDYSLSTRTDTVNITLPDPAQFVVGTYVDIVNLTFMNFTVNNKTAINSEANSKTNWARLAVMTVAHIKTWVQIGG